MDLDTWKTIDELLEQALDLPPEKRDDWLQGLATEHRDLRPTLRRLLGRAAEVETGDFLEALPVFDPPATPSAAPADSREGALVGPYRLIRELGSGGMGAVWLAERSDGMLNRPVALKLPRFVAPDSELAARMAREREILASLTHPNIARLYDAGLDAGGQPFLALEYVEGVPITAFCADRGLERRARLGLFLQVASAVAYAHTKLVVHRDLKPANILVSADAKVSLLDFGIAKLLEERADSVGDLTRPATRLLTPDYASPEQIAGEPITVASDVYSLGVLLYQLLTGALPYRLKGRSVAKLEQAIMSVSVRRPSDAIGDPAAARALRGDLDNIVLKALKAEPDQRYATVAELAEDLKRHLSGYPVLAQPDRTGYRVRKFIGRHRLGVAAGAAVAVALVGGTALALWQARVAIGERDRATQIQGFISSIFRDANPYDAGAAASDELTALALLLQAERRLDAAPNMDPEVRIELLTTLATSLSSLQSLVEAEALARKTVAEASQRLGSNHLLTLKARAALLGVLFPSGRLPEMRAEVEAVLDGVRRHRQAPAELFLGALTLRAELANQEKDYGTAVAIGREALAFARQRFGEGNPQTLNTVILLGTTYQMLGDKALTLETAEEVYRLTGVQGIDPTAAPSRDARMMYGMALAEVGRYADGLEHMAAAIAMTAEVMGPDAQVIGFFLNHLGRYQGRAGLLAESRSSYARSARVIRDALGEGTPAHRAAQSNLARVLLAGRWAPEARLASQSLLQLASAPGQSPQALEWAHTVAAAAAAYDGAPAQARAYTDLSPPQADPRRGGSYLDRQYVLGIIERLSGNGSQALVHLQASLDASRSSAADTEDDMHLLTEIGLSQLALGRLAAAEETLTQALERYRKAQPYPTPRRSDAMVGLARVLMATSRPAAALTLLEEADQFWREFSPDNRWAGETALWLGRCYQELGRSAESATAIARARPILASSPFPGDAEFFE